MPFDLTFISIYMTVAFAIAEGMRGGNTAAYPERIYPGGTFDPMGLSKVRSPSKRRNYMQPGL